MSFFTGDFKLRVGDVEPKEWVLRQGVNNDPIDLTNATDIEIRFVSRLTGSPKVFSKSADPTQVFIVGDPTDGIVKFIQTTGDFPVAETFDFYIVIVDSAGDHSVPDNFEYVAEVRPKFGS